MSEDEAIPVSGNLAKPLSMLGGHFRLLVYGSEWLTKTPLPFVGVFG